MTKPITPCHHCGQPQSKHWAVNYSDGQMVAGNVLICPTAVYTPTERDARPYDLSRQSKVSKRDVGCNGDVQWNGRRYGR